MLLNYFPFRILNSPEFSYKFGTTLTLLPYLLKDFLAASGNEHVTCIDIGHVGNEKVVFFATSPILRKICFLFCQNRENFLIYG